MDQGPALRLGEGLKVPKLALCVLTTVLGDTLRVNRCPHVHALNGRLVNGKKTPPKHAQTRPD